MKSSGTLVFLGDGMADEPVETLDGKTPLQVAHTPAMDSIARAGQCGSLLTLPDAFPTSSDVANMSVLGCDLEREYCGRGALEAAGRGIALASGDIAFRLNFTCVEDGILKDFSAGHITQADAVALIETLNLHFGHNGIRFYPGVSYRNLMILPGNGFSTDVATEKPDDHQGDPVSEHLPKALTDNAEATAALLRKLITETPALLEAHPLNHKARQQGRPVVNGIWLWSGGTAAVIRTLASKFNITSAVISAVDVINGLGRCLGMDVIQVPGATGYIDTNFEAKADAAVAALDSHDFVYLHVEAIDEVSHAQDLALKIKTIEDFDRRLVARVLEAIKGRNVTTVVLPDHPVPIRLGKHTRTPVPVAIAGPRWPPDAVQSYNEIDCPKGLLGHLGQGELMTLLFGDPRTAGSR